MIRLIDAHMHLWDLSRNRYAWLQDDPLPNNPAGDVSSIAHRNYLPADYLRDMAAAQVEACVHVECGLPLERQLDETDWLEETGFPAAIVAGAVLQHPDVDAHLTAQAARPRVCGVRQIVNWHADPLKTYTQHDLLQDEAWRAGFARLAGHGLSFDLQLYPGQMAAAAALAERHPGIPLIINHAGMPTDRDSAGLAAWREGLAALACHPNVSVKISGLAMVDRAWTAASVAPFIQTAIDTFGPSRAMFASNFPVDRIHGAFEAHLDAFLSAISPYTAAEQDALLRGTARRVYRLG